MTEKRRLLAREAQRVVQEHEVVTLADAERDRFLERLEHPPDATPELRRAAHRHQSLIKRSD